MVEGDILDVLWAEAINPDPQGNWLERCRKEHPGVHDPFHISSKACQRLQEQGASPEDLGLFSRLNRYEACFGTLYALDDPGLQTQRLKGLAKLLKPGRTNAKEQAFINALWDIIGNPGDEVVPEPARPGAQTSPEPFGDVPIAVRRVLQSGASASDLSAISFWSRFDSIATTLRVIENSNVETFEDVLGLHESLLGADPSGREGRPGSWPIPMEAAAPSPVSSSGSSDGTPPFLALASVRGFCFTPDSQWLATLRQSGPPAILEAHTGRPGPALANLKQGACLAFSADSKVLVTATREHLMTHRLTDGRLLSQTRCKDILAMEPDPHSGRLVVYVRHKVGNSPGFSFRLLDPNTLGEKSTPRFPGLPGNFYSSAFSPDGSKLAIQYQPLEGGYRMTVWQWPNCTKVAEWTADMPLSWAWGADSRTIGTADVIEGPKLREAESGKVLWATDDTDHDRMTVSQDGKWMVTGEYASGKVNIWNLNDKTKVRSFALEKARCYHIQISPDTKILGIMSEPKTYFWKLDELTH